MQLDGPYLRAAADVDGPRDTSDPAAGRAFEVVGVDVQAHHALAGPRAIRRAARTQRFGQHHRYAAMQQTIRLNRAAIDRHAGANEIVADLQKLDAQMADGGVGGRGAEQFDRDGLFPDSHHGP